MEKGASFPNNWGLLLAGYDSNVLVDGSLPPVTSPSLTKFRKQVSAEPVTELFFLGSVYVVLTNQILFMQLSYFDSQ